MKKNFLRFVERLTNQVNELLTFIASLIEDDLFDRTKNLKKSLRFVMVWLGLVIITFVLLFIQFIDLNNYFQTIRFVPGGVLSLGLSGTYTNSNPLFATSSVDSSVSKLLYASLFTYNQKNQLVGDLASGYQIKNHGQQYIVKLRPNLLWSNGLPLTARDVVFTYNLIKNPDVGSALSNSFSGVSVKALNNSTVEFNLPNQLASFVYSLTNGIVPENLLKNVPPVDLRSDNFSTFQPVGSGPFKWQTININGSNPLNSQAEISLVANSNYFLGQPKIKQLIIKTYPNNNLLTAAFNGNQVNVALNLQSDRIKNLSQVYQYNFLFTAGTSLFFKNNVAPFNNLRIRQALELATNVQSLINRLGFPTHQVFGPLLVGQLAYNSKFNEASYNPTEAIKILTSLGYKFGAKHFLYLKGQLLSFSVNLTNTPLNHLIFDQLKSDYKLIGVKIMPNFEDLNEFAITLQYHQYQSLINSISIGVDPDEFVYWDGSQANPQLLNSLNFSEYNNSSADRSLETARITLNQAVRIIKYAHFLADWQKDVPAIGLFQPGYTLDAHFPIKNILEKDINSTSDIFNNINQWEVKRSMVTN